MLLRVGGYTKASTKAAVQKTASKPKLVFLSRHEFPRGDGYVLGSSFPNPASLCSHTRLTLSFINLSALSLALENLRVVRRRRVLPNREIIRSGITELGRVDFQPVRRRD